MAGDFIREVRREVLSMLGGDPTITQTLGGKVYSSVVNKPVWPFLRWGEPSSVPIRLRCGVGATVSFTVHAFARERVTPGEFPQTAEDYCSDLTAAVKHALHERGWQAGWGRVSFRVLGSRLIPDADDNRAFHGIVTAEARVLAGQ